MTRKEIINQIRQFFDVDELVCNHTFAKWGEASWQFLNTDYLHTLLVIRRDILQSPMTCNYSLMRQRGLRCNMCPLVQEKGSVYLSSHLLGKAGDFTVKCMTAEEARQKIRQNAHLLPHPIRMEEGVTWLHIDTLPQWGVEQKVYGFRA